MGTAEPTMPNDVPVARRQVEVLNALGLHLRPAEKFVGLAGKFQADIRVIHLGRESNGKSMLDLMTLAALPGARLELVASGSDAEEAVSALADLVAARFFEDDNGTSSPRPDLT